ncbi:MAG: biotin--[acetyl-CoA-carboxylase] ligase [Phycisphaerae bacterium]
MTARRSHRLEAGALSRDLATARVGRHVRVFDALDSTNSYALDTLAPDAARFDGAAVFAEYQSAGRGRLGRRWETPRGAGLTFTVLLHETSDRLPASRIVLAAAVAAADAIAETTDVEPVIRWPNDLYVRDRKLAGILIEVRTAAAGTRAVAVGIGVNCLQHAAHFPPALRDRATSLEIESGHAIDRTAVARAMLRRLDDLLAAQKAMDDAGLAEAWRERSADIGARATLRDGGRSFVGRIVDVAPAEGLLLQIDGGGLRHFDPATTTREQEPKDA